MSTAVLQKTLSASGRQEFRVPHKAIHGTIEDHHQHHQRNNSASFVDLRSVKILSKTEWNNINERLYKKEKEALEKQRKAEIAAQLKQKSQDKIKDWENTVLGQRQKKLQQREERLAKEEERRKALDIEEGEYMAEKRKAAIEAAKTQQYYQTDRVKNFHSALQLTEVLKEREAQLELKRLKLQAERGKDDLYLEIDRRNYEEELLREQEKQKKRIAECKENADFLKLQIDNSKTEEQIQLEEEQREGDNLRRLAVCHALEKQRIEQIAREERQKRQVENLQHIDDVRRMREIERIKEEEKDEEIRLFVAAKRKMVKLKMEKEKEIAEEKLNSLDRIKERLSNQLKAKMDDEEDRMNKAIDEREKKFVSDENEKLRRRQELLDSITHHRIEQVEKQEREAKEKRLSDMEMLKARRDADEMLRKTETEKRAMRFKSLQTVARENLEKRDLTLVAAKESKLAEVDELEENKKMLEREEDVFQDYANRVIDHSDKAGRNTYALRKAARAGHGGGLGPVLPGKGGLRPSYKTSDGTELELPTYQNDSTKAIKEHQNGMSRKASSGKTSASETGSKNRMGFVW